VGAIVDVVGVVVVCFVPVVVDSDIIGLSVVLVVGSGIAVVVYVRVVCSIKGVVVVSESTVEVIGTDDVGTY